MRSPICCTSLGVLAACVACSGPETPAEEQRSRENVAAPWGDEVSGLRMRLTEADDERSANIRLTLELQNTSDLPFWLERLWDVYRVEATDTSGGRVYLGDRLDPPGPWTTRKTDIQPGETIRWTDWYGRFRRVQPPKGSRQVRIRFVLPLRRARADEPDLSVSTNWLTLPTHRSRRRTVRTLGASRPEFMEKRRVASPGGIGSPGVPRHRGPGCVDLNNQE